MQKTPKSEDGRVLHWKRRFKACEQREQTCQDNLRWALHEFRQAVERKKWLEDFYAEHKGAHNKALVDAREAQIAVVAARATALMTFSKKASFSTTHVYQSSDWLG